MKKKAEPPMNSLQWLYHRVFKGIGWLVLAAILTGLYLFWNAGVRP